MDPELERIIGMFNAAQLKAVEILEAAFNCPRPTTSDDFIFRCVPVIRASNYEAGGYKIRPHGIGMEINIDGTKIDFDFGQNGQFNGFDSWRLYEFVQKNRIKSLIRCEEEMDKLVKSAVAGGYIVKGSGMGNVYYANS
jgi:hypothetical protein